MIKTFLALTLILLTIPVLAENNKFDNIGVEVAPEAGQTKPMLKKSEAVQWLKEFSAARDQTSDPLFLKNFEKRQNHTRALMALRDQAEKIFGTVVSQYGDCTKAVEAVNEYWKMEISLITDPSNNQTIKVGSVVTFAWDGGISFASCRRLIEGLK